jgi:hypothetical protein
MARSLHPYTYLAGMPVASQHFLFETLALTGRCLGYLSEYPRYAEGEK